MNSALPIRKLLALIRQRARAGERTRSALPEFNRLYRFYTTSALNEDDTQSAATEQSDFLDEQPSAATTMAAVLSERLARQQTRRLKYADTNGYYALLMSFYGAFVAPLEQELAIVDAGQELGLTALVVETRPGRRARVEIADQDWEDTRVALAAITQAFGNLGEALLPNTFILADFMYDARRPDQDNY